jgi:hypothetical protein
MHKNGIWANFQYSLSNKLKRLEEENLLKIAHKFDNNVSKLGFILAF